MDKPDQTPPYRTPPWCCCSFENLVLIFSPPLIPFFPLTSGTRGVFPDGQRCLKGTQSTVITGKRCKDHDVTIACESTHLSESPSSTSITSLLSLARLQCRGYVLPSHGHQQGLRPSRVPLVGAKLWFCLCPMELGGFWGRNGAGSGYRQGCGTVVMLALAKPAKAGGGRGPGPEEIAGQGLRRAAATRSPLAFSGTATARRRKPPS